MAPVRTRAGWAALAAATVVAAGAALPALSPPTAAGLKPPTTMRGAAASPTPTPNAPNALKRWAATNGGGSQAQSPTLAQTIAVATNYSLVLATKDSFPPFLAQMRR
ncbi:MAG: hypothetical protein JO075_01475, partial [Acidimicrobiia bacterium]|nr:hypothetical protein [Acidimicrobiia bacterium]